MCKTSSKVLNINFGESQTGVKGRKPRVSIHWTIRRWVATLGELSPLHHPPPLKTRATSRRPLGQRSGCSAAAAPARRVRKVSEKKRYLVEKVVMLRRLLQGTDAAAHGGGGHTIQEERACSRPTGSTRPLHNCARIPALGLASGSGTSSPHMLPSSLCTDSL